tara:strand:+ start:610 stop:1377 length:768 start_codon:yes stop_codon:yes gene_type:complete
VKFLKEKLKIQNSTIDHIINNVKQNNLSLCLMQKNYNLSSVFSEKDNKKNFPPDGNLLISDLDTFFLIKLKNEVVGFYRIINLDFEQKIELHGSFAKYNTFLIRSYYLLTKKFVEVVFSTFNNHKIESLVHRSNNEVIKFLDYLNFIKLNEDKQGYIRFIKKGILNISLENNRKKISIKKSVILKIESYYLLENSLKKKKIYILYSKKNLDDLLSNKSLILNQKEIDTLHIRKKHMANVKAKKISFLSILFRNNY